VKITEKIESSSLKTLGAAGIFKNSLNIQLLMEKKLIEQEIKNKFSQIDIKNKHIYS
jgi:hypothetical protein